MSAETLRRAAALMRERAEAATPGPWVDECEFHQDHGGADTYHHVVAHDLHVGEVERGQDAAHIASWHPTVALAVADWLTYVADQGDRAAINHRARALRVARAYLGDDA